MTEAHLLASIQAAAHAQENALAAVKETESRLACGQGTAEQVQVAWVAYRQTQLRLAAAHRAYREHQTAALRRAIQERGGAA